MDDVKKNVTADFIMSILLIIFGILIGWASLNMRVYNKFLDAPGFFPLILGIIFVVLGTIMLISAVKRKALEQVQEVLHKDRVVGFFKHDQFKRVMILIALMAVYIFGLIGNMHFTIATAIYLFATFLYLRSSSVIKIIIISIVTAALISAVFKNFFNIPLP